MLSYSSGARPAWCAALLALLTASPFAAEAADHADTPTLDIEGALDVADVFAWTAAPTPDSTERFVYLAMTLGARPAPGVQYVFHLDNRAALTSGGTTQNAICTFSQDLMTECWLGETGYAVGDASAGLEGIDLKVWTGFVSDPTFGDLETLGFVRDTLAAARTRTASVSEAGCPTLTEAERATLVTDLGNGSVDTFGRGDVFLLLLRAPIEVVAPNGSLLGVYASSRRGTR